MFVAEPVFAGGIKTVVLLYLVVLFWASAMYGAKLRRVRGIDDFMVFVCLLSRVDQV